MSTSTKRRKKAGEIYEIETPCSPFTIRTRKPLATMQKLAEKDCSMFIKYKYGWIHLLPEEVIEMIEKGESTARYQIESPGTGVTPARMLIKVSKDMF